MNNMNLSGKRWQERHDFTVSSFTLLLLYISHFLYYAEFARTRATLKKLKNVLSKEANVILIENTLIFLLI